MASIAFDSLAFAKRLKDGGFTEVQAETLAEAEAEFIGENLATKRDINELEFSLQRDIKEMGAALRAEIKETSTGLRADIKETDTGLRIEIKQLDLKIEHVRADLQRDMKELEYRLTIKLGTLLAVAVGAIAALVKLL